MGRYTADTARRSCWLWPIQARYGPIHLLLMDGDGDVFALRRAGWSFRGIAARLNLSVGAVQRALRRAEAADAAVDAELDALLGLDDEGTKVLAEMRANRCRQDAEYHERCSCENCPLGHRRNWRLVSR